MSLTGQYTLETPENVEVHFELAGPGSRFCAWVIDSLLMFLIAFVLIMGFLFAGVGWVYWSRSFSSILDDTSLSWVSALFILTIALVVFGYYTFFELIMRGQTPGKRHLKLRVMRDDGTPAMPLDVIIRNLVRIVDFLPGFYFVGGLACLYSSANKRLGDMAAGTIVIKEAQAEYHGQTDRKKVRALAEVRMSNAALTVEEQTMIRGFLARREELLREARRILADRIAGGLFEKHSGYFDDAEAYLERLAQGRHFER